MSYKFKKGNLIYYLDPEIRESRCAIFIKYLDDPEDCYEIKEPVLIRIHNNYNIFYKIVPLDRVKIRILYKSFADPALREDIDEGIEVEPDFKSGDKFIIKSNHIFSGYKGEIIYKLSPGVFEVKFDGDVCGCNLHSKYMEKETTPSHFKAEEIKVGNRVLVEGVIKNSLAKDGTFMVDFPFLPMDIFVNKSRIVKKVD